MSMVISEKLFTVQEFEAFLEQHPEGLFELVAGRIVEKVPTQEHGHLAVKIGGRLQVLPKTMIWDGLLLRHAIDSPMMMKMTVFLM